MGWARVSKTDGDVSKTDEDARTPDAAPAPKSKKKLVIAGAAAVLLVGGGGAAWALMGGEKGKPEAEEAAHEEGAKPAYVEVPAMVVNLRTPDGQPRFLKLRFTLVAGEGHTDEVTARLPALIDGLQPFLRELRPEDLAGSAAVFRVKEEMLTRAHRSLGAGKVTDVLIQDLVQQ